MPNVLHVDIDEDIVLDEKRLTNSNGKIMPYDIQQRVLITMTIAMEREKCDWRELTWKVNKDGIISVKKKT